MRLLADENIPRTIIERLREAGHEVKAISEDSPSIKDEEVLMEADRENRTLFTFDSDYGELIHLYGRRPRSGVIHLRIRERTPKRVAHRLLEVIGDQKLTFEDRITVIDEKKVRQKGF